MVQPAVLSQSLRLFCKKSMSNSKCRVPRLVIKRSFLKYNRNVEVTGNFPVNWRLQHGCSGGCYGLAVLSSQPHLPAAQLSFLTLKPKLPLGPDQSGGASTRVPCSPTASVLGSGKCPSSSGQDFGLGIPWLHSAKEPAFEYKAVSKRAQPLDTAQKVSGSPVPRRGWGWSLCPACLGCWAWTFSTLSPRLADRGQREMLPLLTDQAEWKKESRKLLCLFSCLLPVKALVGVQQWTCWSYGPVLPSLQCTKRALKIHISGFEELPCILQHKGNLPLWATAGLYDCSLPLSESYPASDAETKGNKTM